MNFLPQKFRTIVLMLNAKWSIGCARMCLTLTGAQITLSSIKIQHQLNDNVSVEEAIQWHD